MCDRVDFNVFSVWTTLFPSLQFSVLPFPGGVFERAASFNSDDQFIN